MQFKAQNITFMLDPVAALSIDVCVRPLDCRDCGFEFRRQPRCLSLVNAVCFKVDIETSAHILCECEALASLRHAHLGSFFLEPEDIRRIGLGAI